MVNRTKRYNWPEVQEYYDTGRTFRQTQEKFGFSNEAWRKAVRRGDIKSRAYKVTAFDIINGKKIKNRSFLKAQLIKHNLLPYFCAVCGNAGEWRDKPLALDLDHINGVNDDDRIENLRFLCPNCHRQTDTYAGKNKGCGTYSRSKIKYKTRGYNPED